MTRSSHTFEPCEVRREPLLSILLFSLLVNACDSLSNMVTFIILEVISVDQCDVRSVKLGEIR